MPIRPIPGSAPARGKNGNHVPLKLQLSAGTCYTLPYFVLLYQSFLIFNFLQTHLATLFYAACRDPKIFDNPNEFRPERWLDKKKKYHPFASMPFGHGSRMCVGKLYMVVKGWVREGVVEGR